MTYLPSVCEVSLSESEEELSEEESVTGTCGCQKSRTTFPKAGKCVTVSILAKKILKSRNTLLELTNTYTCTCIAHI